MRILVLNHDLLCFFLLKILQKLHNLEYKLSSKKQTETNTICIAQYKYTWMSTRTFISRIALLESKLKTSTQLELCQIRLCKTDEQNCSFLWWTTRDTFKGMYTLCILSWKTSDPYYVGQAISSSTFIVKRCI